MIGDNKFFSKNTDDGDHAVPGVQPIVRNASIENEMFQYVPSNTPIYTSQTPHRLLSKQDWGHVIEHKDLYAKADWEKPGDLPSRNYIKRWFYKEQPFSSEKTMRPLYIKFEPKFNGETIRKIWVSFKIKFKYNIGLYTITNSLTQHDKDLMNNRVYTAQNRDMYGEAYRRNIKMASPITGKIEEVPSGYHRMFTRKPQIHYHSIVYKDKVEIEEPLTK